MRVLEGNVYDAGATQTDDPQPGTPEFAARAAARKARIAAPAPADQPGPQSVEVKPPADVEDANAEWTTPETQANTSANPTTTDPRDLGMFDIKPDESLLHALIDDKTPLNEANPEDDIINRLTQQLLGPPDAAPQVRPFTPGESLAVGILGGMDKDFFTHVVMPMLVAQKNAPRQAYLDEQTQAQHRTMALEALSRLTEARAQHANANALSRMTRAQAALTEATNVQEGNMNRRLAVFQSMQRENQKLTAAGKIPDRVFGTYTLATIAHQDAVAMKKLIDNNPNAFGLVTGRFHGVGPGGDARAQLSALAGTVNESIMMITQRRGLNKESQKKIGGSLPDVEMSLASLKQAVNTAIRTTGQFITGTEAQYPSTVTSKAKMIQLLQQAHSDPDQITAIITDPESWLATQKMLSTQSGFENGDREHPTTLWRPDSDYDKLQEPK